MKILTICFSLLLGICLITPGFAQKSPAADAHGTVGEVKIDITYHSPSVRGRVVYGELVPYGKVWRTGANNATTFEVNADVKVNGEMLPKGKYGFFTIPQDNGEWVIIFNEVWDQWGAYNYDETEDVLRLSVQTREANEPKERLLFEVSNKGVVTFAWDKLTFDLQVSE